METEVQCKKLEAIFNIEKSNVMNKSFASEFVLNYKENFVFP